MSEDMGTTLIRPAIPDDVPVILALVRELAVYEREEHQVVTTEADLRRALFDDGHVAYCHLAELDGVPVGFALWFLNFSTWTGLPGIYLEDLFVKPVARGTGLGKALLMTLADIAVERGYKRVEWSVLDWNEAAAGFYRSLGAKPNDGWTVWRLLPERA
jgi:GNAT superfamily N-acetyltransferase